MSKCDSIPDYHTDMGFHPSQPKLGQILLFDNAVSTL